MTRRDSARRSARFFSLRWRAKRRSGVGDLEDGVVGVRFLAEAVGLLVTAELEGLLVEEEGIFEEEEEDGFFWLGDFNKERDDGMIDRIAKK
jgi:hypothetical protein